MLLSSISRANITHSFTAFSGTLAGQMPKRWTLYHWIACESKQFFEYILEWANSTSRFSTRSRRFMDAYHKGLNGEQAAWAAKKYRGHRVLPSTILKEFDNEKKAN